MNIQQRTQRAVVSYQEQVKPLKVILSPDNTAQEQDAVKRLALNNNLDAKKGEVTSASIEKETRDSFVVPADNKKQSVEELRTLANEIQAKSRAGTPIANQNRAMGATPTANQKPDKSIAPISSLKEEKNNDVKPDHKQRKQSEATYVAPPPTTNQTKGQLKETDTSEQHLVTSGPSMKLPTKVKSVSVAKDHNAFAPGALQGTRAISEATHNKRFKASDFKSQPLWDFDDQYLLDNVTPQSVSRYKVTYLLIILL